MRPNDIRIYKNGLRDAIKSERRSMPQDIKAELDRRIARNVLRLYQYRSADTLLVYVSTKIEVDTFEIMANAWRDGKRVAVPRCIPGTRRMEFHYISSTDDLSPGSFGVLEPEESSPVVTDFAGCLMLLPALSLDYLGYRLGYGKGYYDRYLARFTGPLVGICYSSDIRRHMYHGRFDRPVDVILTEGWIKDVSSRRHKEQKKIPRQSAAPQIRSRKG